MQPWKINIGHWRENNDLNVSLGSIYFPNPFRIISTKFSTKTDLVSSINNRYIVPIYRFLFETWLLNPKFVNPIFSTRILASVVNRSILFSIPKQRFQISRFCFFKDAPREENFQEIYEISTWIVIKIGFSYSFRCSLIRFPINPRIEIFKKKKARLCARRSRFHVPPSVR